MTLQNELKRYRKKHNLSQAEIAKKINVSQQAYANYENGTRLPNIEILIKIADEYGVSLDILTGRYTQSK